MININNYIDKLTFIYFLINYVILIRYYIPYYLINYLRFVKSRSINFKLEAFM